MNGGASSARQTPSSVSERSPSAFSHESCHPATAPAQRATGSCTRSRLRTQDYFECGAEPRTRGQRESALDALGARADVLQALPGSRGLTVESFAVVTHGDEAPVEAQTDLDLGPSCVRMLAHIGQPLLDDAKHL